MGCGVSKEEIVEPSRIQSVVVSLGSPESHLKAHEALHHQQQQQQNYGLISLVNVEQLKEPLPLDVDAANELRIRKTSPDFSSRGTRTTTTIAHADALIATAITVSSTSAESPSAPRPPPLATSEQVSLASAEPNLAGETEDSQVLSTSSLVCLANAQSGSSDDVILQSKIKVSSFQQHLEDRDASPVARTQLPSKTTASDDFMRGSLECLREILDDSEANSLRLAIETTAKKIMNYGGGVLHSLKDQVGSLSPPTAYSAAFNNDKAQPQYVTTGGGGEGGGDSTDKLAFAKQNFDRLRSPRSPSFVKSPRPELLDYSRKNLPAILAPCTSNIVDKAASLDPFIKAPLSALYQSRLSVSSSPPEDKSELAAPTTGTATTELSRSCSSRTATASCSFSPSSSSSSPSLSPHASSSPSPCSSLNLEQSIQQINDAIVLDDHPSPTNCHDNHNDNSHRSNAAAAIDDQAEKQSTGSRSPLHNDRWAKFESINNSDDADIETIVLDEPPKKVSRPPQQEDILLPDDGIYDECNSNSNNLHQSSSHCRSREGDDSEELHHASSNSDYTLKAWEERDDMQNPLSSSCGASSHREACEDDEKRPLSSSEFYS